MGDEYDENSLLTEYVWSHGTPYMTKFEMPGWKTVDSREKRQNTEHEQMQRLLEENFGHENDSAVVEALRHGRLKFMESVRDRVLRENLEIVNRCPELARTPTAKQCRWCGHDWHTT